MTPASTAKGKTQKAKAAPKNRRAGSAKAKSGGSNDNTKSLIQQINTLNLGGLENPQSENIVSLRESTYS